MIFKKNSNLSLKTQICHKEAYKLGIFYFKTHIFIMRHFCDHFIPFLTNTYAK